MSDDLLDGPVTTAVLVIGSWSTTCSACSQGADYSEQTHATILGYQVNLHKACGAVFVAKISSYAGAEGLDHIRPDLPYAFTEENFDAPLPE